MANLQNQILRIVWEYTNAVGHQCRNVGYVEGLIAMPATSDLDDYSAEIGAGLTDWLSTSSEFVGVEFTFGDGTSEPPQYFSSNGAGAGGTGDALCPPNVQALFKKKGVLSGRHNQGRFYLPDVREAEVDDSGNLNSTALARGASFLSDHVFPATAGLGTDASAVMYDAVNGVAHSQIASLTLETKVATQRRRFPR